MEMAHSKKKNAICVHKFSGCWEINMIGVAWFDCHSFSHFICISNNLRFSIIDSLTNFIAEVLMTNFCKDFRVICYRLG